MNCKPGDIACIVGPATTPNLGRLVRCTRLLLKGEEMQLNGIVFCATSHSEYWAVEGRLEGEDPFGRTVMVNGGPIGDRWLRPIRNPGDDAVDESKAWLPPVPLPAIDPSLISKKESEHAD